MTTTQKVITAIENIRHAENAKLYSLHSAKDGARINARVETYDLIVAEINRCIARDERNDEVFETREIRALISKEYDMDRSDDGAVNMALGAYYSTIGAL